MTSPLAFQTTMPDSPTHRTSGTGLGNMPIAHPPMAAAPEPYLARTSTELLAEITADLSSGADIRALLRRFLEPIIQLSQARAGAVRLLGGQAQLRLVSEMGLPAQMGCVKDSVGRHCGGCGRAVDSDSPTWSAQLGECDVHNTPHLLTSMGFKHMLAVPLGHRGRVLGVYNLFFDEAESPPPKVQSMLRAIGDVLGLALDNARLETENLRALVMQERQTMAAEVHDAVAQDVAFLRMRLPLLEQAIRQHDDAQAIRFMAELRDALGHAHGSLREIITQFRTPPDAAGLGEGLRKRVNEFTGRSGIAIILDNQLPHLTLPPALETQVLYIVSEALTNVSRHAGATHAWVSLRQAGPQGLELKVEDNGSGLRSHPGEPGHHGINIMGERARRLRGQVELLPRSGGGTQVVLRFPVSTTQAPT